MNTENFLPNIYLNKHMKQALLLQLVSKEPINILFVGDPYSGKTTILQEMAKQKEKATFCDGILFTKILTPTNVLIKETMNNTELLCVDDVDSCTAEDRMVLKDILNSKMSVLAVANPKFGRFDPYDLIRNQISLDTKTISSFDLIFPLKDFPEEKKDRMLAKLMFNKSENKLFDLPKGHKVIINIELEEKMIDYYVKNRATPVEDFVVIKHVLRTFTTLIKLTKASAILNERLTANEDDLNVAIEIIEYSFNQMTKDAESGVIDIDRISSAGLTAPKRKNVKMVSKIIEDLTERNVLVEDIIEKGKRLGIETEKIEEALEQLRIMGDIYEPHVGFVTKL